ncbi:cna B-type domain protein [Latilactobacillus graminis DSM 20719]|uniref:Cna B-type domain protein n=2 Tax=Latilactobacillus graminis TaxID=60519 RepID=A0AA89I0X4_9LACO|nr:cna B-type domain protein [Latilactobacillus graminis DSM 20719]
MGNLNTSVFATTNTNRVKTSTPNIIIRGLESRDHTKTVPNAKINLTSTTDTQKSYLLTANDEGLFNHIIDNQTGLRVNHIDVGVYKISTVENPIGFRLVGEKAGLIVEVTDTQHEIAIYYSEVVDGTISLMARTSSGNPVPGVIFTATDKASGAVYQFAPTDAGGRTILSLAASRYTIGVQSAPKNYTVSDQLPSFDLESNLNIAEEILFNHRQSTGNIIIKLVDAQTQAGLADAKISLTPVEDTGHSQVATTNADGEAIWTNMAAGQYHLAIKAMIPGYAIDDDQQQSVTVASDQTKRISITAHRQATANGAFRIRSISESGRAIAHVQYQIAALDGSQQQTVNTNQDGIVDLVGLSSGQYTVKETKVPSGYQLLQGQQVVDVSNERYPDVVFTHQIKRTDQQHSLIVNATDMQDNIVTGVQFKIKLINSNESYEQTVLVDNAGVARFDNVPLGKYEIQQVNQPVGYENQSTSKTIDVTNNQANQLDWQFHRQLSDVQFVVKDAETGAPLRGASFLVRTTNPDDQGRQTFMTAQTDRLGQTVLSGLPTGAFTYQQVTTTAGNDVDQTTHAGVIQPGGVSYNQFTVQNQQTRPSTANRLIVRKVSQQGRPLNGAQFKLLNEAGREVATKITQNGTADFSELHAGQYTVQETQAPTGYELDQTPQTIQVGTQASSDYMAVFVDHRQTVNATNPIVINAQDDQGGVIAGAVFKLWTDLPDDQGQTSWEITTDQHGSAVLPKAVTGQYRIQMVSVPVGYQLNTTVYSMTVNQAGHNQLSVVAAAAKHPQTLQIHKTDLHDKKLAGAVFHVKSLQTGKTSEVVTDKAGIAEVGQLEAGRYAVREIKAPAGYRLDSLEHQVILKDGQSLTSMTIQDAPQTGQLIINKTAPNGKPLADATFVVRDKQGKLIGQYQSNLAGRIKLNELVVGDYTIQEIKAPDGYQLNPEVFKVRVMNQKTVAVTVVDQKAVPEDALGTLRITNVDQKRQTPLVGATFMLEDQTGKVVRQQILVDTNGRAVVDNLKAGTYHLIQTTAATAYKVRTYAITIKVHSRQETAVTVANEQRAGSVIVNQIDGNTHQPLVGAKYQLQSANGKVLINNLMSDDRGHVIIRHLNPGAYQLVQISAPKGYDVLKNPIKFKMTNTGKN